MRYFTFSVCAESLQSSVHFTLAASQCAPPRWSGALWPAAAVGTVPISVCLCRVLCGLRGRSLRQVWAENEHRRDHVRKEPQRRDETASSRPHSALSEVEGALSLPFLSESLRPEAGGERPPSLLPREADLPPLPGCPAGTGQPLLLSERVCAAVKGTPPRFTGWTVTLRDYSGCPGGHVSQQWGLDKSHTESFFRFQVTTTNPGPLTRLPASTRG